MIDRSYRVLIKIVYKCCSGLFSIDETVNVYDILRNVSFKYQPIFVKLQNTRVIPCTPHAPANTQPVVSFMSVDVLVLGGWGGGVVRFKNNFTGMNKLCTYCVIAYLLGLTR